MRPPHRLGLGAFVLANVTVAPASGYLILGAFRAGDCDGGCNSGAMLAWTGGIAVASTLVAVALWMRSRRTWRDWFAIAAATIALPLLAIGITYAVRLERRTPLAVGTAEVRASLDYSHMLIAVRDLPSLGIVAGQRCAFGSIRCGERPRTIEAVCTGLDVMQIPEADWGALMRLPGEDFPNMPPDVAAAAFPRSCDPE